jgi:hypothetical protein
MLKAYHLENHYEKHIHGSTSHLQKLINCPDAMIQGINTTAYLSRLEVYVDENQWTSASLRLKFALTSFINLLEEDIASVLLQWNKQRSYLFEH